MFEHDCGEGIYYKGC